MSKKLIPKYQKGKKLQRKDTPNTFIGAVTEQLGGDYQKGDHISALASIHPLVGLGLRALDLGYDINGLRYDEKSGKDVVLDIFSLLPGIRYAREINLLKKSKDPIMYYVKQLRKYIRKNSDRINIGIGGGKSVDLVDDATH